MKTWHITAKPAAVMQRLCEVLLSCQRCVRYCHFKTDLILIATYIASTPSVEPIKAMR